MAAVFNGVSATYVLSTSSVRAESTCPNQTLFTWKCVLTYLCCFVFGSGDEICAIGRPLEISYRHVCLMRLSVVYHFAILLILAFDLNRVVERPCVVPLHRTVTLIRPHAQQ